MANRERLLGVADYMERYPDKVAMDNWCGTKQCIAGHAVCLYADEVLQREIFAAIEKTEELYPGEDADAYWQVGSFNVPELARELLGLSREQTEDLFYIQDTNEAIAALRRVANNG